MLGLWSSPAATAPILPLAWESPYAAGTALKKKKDQKKKKKKKERKKEKKKKKTKKKKKKKKKERKKKKKNPFLTVVGCSLLAVPTFPGL